MARSNANPKAHGKDWIRLAVFNLTTCTGHFDTTLQKSCFFFSKSVKKSVKRGERVLHARSARSSHAREKTVCPQSHSPFSDSFQTFCLTARAYNRDCFAVYFHIWDGFSFRDGEKDDSYQQTTRFTSNKFNKQYRVNATRNKILSKSCARNKRL